MIPELGLAGIGLADYPRFPELSCSRPSLGATRYEFIAFSLALAKPSAYRGTEKAEARGWIESRRALGGGLSVVTAQSRRSAGH
ncbi:hypothetical protein FRX94_07250 [Corynebacterium canis]|uniref:Uncharacterized protein n=1 Tax=Corynebacterium canis TaxID=679663 RepID=A0A5C5UEA9_9CORY|nr:hypothetical protein [Corynebacterium canis]TWT25051.1 hypothetical protein FRX94_07250 [Corynebacterium canis]WJY76065.1 hypothetical protein CCANI_11230 [Corynebacterium canis]